MNKAPADVLAPHVRLSGEVSPEMFSIFLEQFETAKNQPDPITVEVTTIGGDADVGRRIADDIRLFRHETGRNPVFLGKTTVFSAGATIMSAFRRQDRWLERQCMLMIHCRKLTKTVELSTFLKAERGRVKALLGEIDASIKVQTWGFEALIEDSDVTLEELEERAAHNWYLDAEEALQRRLIGGIF